MIKNWRHHAGFSLIEVLVVVAIIGITGAITVPPMLSWLANQGVQAASRELYGNMRKAQSTAVKENRNCAITFNGTTGYLVYVDSNRNFRHDSDEAVLARVVWSEHRNVALKSINFPVNDAGNPTLSFRPNLIPSAHNNALANGTVELSSPAGRVMKVVVNISGNIALRAEHE